MKTITPQIYAKAFLASASGKTGHELDGLVVKFMDVIKKTGGWSRRHEIVKQVDVLWRREHKRPLVTIESARPLSEQQGNLLKKDLGVAEENYETKINPALIAGVRVQKENMQVDGSLAHLLKQMFKS